MAAGCTAPPAALGASARAWRVTYLLTSGRLSRLPARWRQPATNERPKHRVLHPPRELRLMKIKPRDSREQIRRKPPGSGHLDCQHKEPGTRHSLSFRMPVANSDKRKKKKKRTPLTDPGHHTGSRGKRMSPGDFSVSCLPLPRHRSGCRQETGPTGGRCDLSKSPTFSFSNYHQQVTQ